MIPENEPEKEVAGESRRSAATSPRVLVIRPAEGPAMRQFLEDSFSAVSKPNFAGKYALENSRRDLKNARLCTVLESIIENWGKQDLAKTTPKKEKTRKREASKQLATCHLEL